MSFILCCTHDLSCFQSLLLVLMRPCTYCMAQAIKDSFSCRRMDKSCHIWTLSSHTRTSQFGASRNRTSTVISLIDEGDKNSQILSLFLLFLLSFGRLHSSCRACVGLCPQHKNAGKTACT